MVFSSPSGPVENLVDWLDVLLGGEEESAGFGEGDGDQVWGVLVGVADVGGEDGEEGVGEHGEGDPAVP